MRTNQCQPGIFTIQMQNMLNTNIKILKTKIGTELMPLCCDQGFVVARRQKVFVLKGHYQKKLILHMY